jgi:glycosyltransferase involved in cell wall biosynthesis
VKNVCFFNSLNFWGGGEKLHLEYAMAFKEMGYNTFIFAYPDGPLWNAAINNKIDVHPVKARALSFLNPFELKKLQKAYQKLNVDTVIFSTSQDVKLGGIAAKRAGINRIVYLRGLAVPIKNSFINRYLFKHVLSHVATNSEATASFVTKHLKDAVDPKKLGIIYHGIEINEPPTGKLLPEIKNKKHGIVLGNAGRLTKQKGQHFLVDVAERLKLKGVDFSLFIAGTGELENELRTLIQQKELENHVYLLGFISEMDTFMNSLDIFLLSSAWEGFGYVLVEAMLREKPVVAFDVSSNPEIIERDKTGFLVPYPDAEAFADQTKLLIENEALRLEMGQNGRKRVEAKFEIRERVIEFENFIKKTIPE